MGVNRQCLDTCYYASIAQTGPHTTHAGAVKGSPIQLTEAMVERVADLLREAGFRVLSTKPQALLVKDETGQQYMVGVSAY